MMRSKVLNVISLWGICLLFGACTGTQNNPTDLGLVGGTGESGIADQEFSQNNQVTWPSTLPEDSLQPWEELNADGFAVPAGGWPRATSSLNLDSDFTPGVERHLQGGDVSDNGEASSLASGTQGDMQLSYAIYRVPGVGAPLGIVSADVNLHPDGLASPSAYWLGVADYNIGGWAWHGPFTDSHVRLQMPGSNYESPLGSYFICVAAYDGASFDVVGIGADGKDPVDTTAPATPSALVHTDYGSSTLLEWLPVPESDIAGYRVYHRTSSFSVATQAQQVNYLIGDSKFLLTGLAATTYVRVAAVDTSGNESALSEMVTCDPLEEPAIEATLEVDNLSGLIGDTFNLTANGGDTYDFDLDGDGTFDVMGNVTGLATLNATQTGIIRPLVRANNTGGTSIAMGAVSLIIASNSRPVVQGFVDPAFGAAPLTVQFTSNQIDVDGDVVEYIWDFTSDGGVNFRFSTAGGATDPAPYTFTTPGLYNAKVRAWDDEGAWDVDTVTIQVKEFVGFDWSMPGNYAGQQYPDFAIIDGNPAFTYFDSNNSVLYFIRATNSTGTQWFDPLLIDPIPGAGVYNSLNVVDGRPAVAYLDAGLRYLIADNPDGSSWSTPRVLLDGGAVGGKVSLEMVNGNPAVGYIGAGTANYIRADSIDGFTWGNVPVVVDNSGGVNQYIDMEEIDGNPALAYYDAASAFYIRATSSTGNVAGDWADPRVNVSGIANCSGWVSLEEVSGRPAIAYYETTGTTKVAYHRALNSTGQTGLDWPAGFIEVASGNGCGQYTALGVVNGLAVVSFSMSEGWQNYYYSSASNSAGTSWNNPISMHDGISITVGEYPVVLENNGAPYIGCENLSTSQLFFARPVYE